MLERKSLDGSRVVRVGRAGERIDELDPEHQPRPPRLGDDLIPVRELLKPREGPLAELAYVLQDAVALDDPHRGGAGSKCELVAAERPSMSASVPGVQALVEQDQ